MLVLKRGVNERILLYIPGVPEPIDINVVRIEGQKVKLGINAPKDVRIYRHELIESGVVQPIIGAAT